MQRLSAKYHFISDLLLLTLGWILCIVLFFGYLKWSKGSLENAYKAWDGPSYVIAGLSEYVPARATELNTIQSKEIRPDFTFLPAHFPLYPTLIRIISFIDPFKSMLGVTLLFSLGFIYSLYFFAKVLGLSNPVIWSGLALILPPRYFIVSHTGSSEPLFLLFTTLSLTFFVRRQHWLAALLASLALATRPQGALLGVGYALVALYELSKTHQLKKIIKDYLPYLLIPITLILIFTYYQRQTGNFWAFFSAISIFNHFAPTLFPSLHFGAPNIETFWHEANVLYYGLYLYAIIKLFEQKYIHFALMALVFYLPLLFLQHSDISRYSLSLLPFAWVAFHEYLSRKNLLLTAILLLPAIIMYSSDFIQYNRAL